MEHRNELSRGLYLLKSLPGSAGLPHYPTFAKDPVDPDPTTSGLKEIVGHRVVQVWTHRAFQDDQSRAVLSK